jgi:acylphosphatase
LDEDFTAVRVRISGRVQGVAYRAWTQSEAEKLGLSGWVRNEPDGSVMALIAGPNAKISEMVDAFWQGPRLARVTGVDTEAAEFDAQQRGFQITY